MNGLVSRPLGFALFTLVWLGVNGATQAWERPPVKVKANFHFRFDVKVGPDIQRPTAPWYAYFPTDPRLMPSMQVSPYPPWPQQFPPPGPPTDALKKANAEGPTSGAMVAHWPAFATQGGSAEPVGSVPSTMPSYWYRGR